MGGEGRGGARPPLLLFHMTEKIRTFGADYDFFWGGCLEDSQHLPSSSVEGEIIALAIRVPCLLWAGISTPTVKARSVGSVLNCKSFGNFVGACMQ